MKHSQACGKSILLCPCLIDLTHRTKTKNRGSIDLKWNDTASEI